MGAAVIVPSLLPRRSEARDPLDRIWYDFRNLFGLVWSRRLQERINGVAQQREVPVEMTPLESSEGIAVRDISQRRKISSNRYSVGTCGGSSTLNGLMHECLLRRRPTEEFLIDLSLDPLDFRSGP
ncbi:MAG: hypothetical protein R3B91_23040 [Planctomycetaceae bacterium]